jgi:hypothetical protein
MKRKRSSRAKNKVQGSVEGSLIKREPERNSDAPRVELRLASIVVPRSTLFTAELEELIDMIARERVYRAMLAAGLGRRLLMAPAAQDHDDATRL